MPLNIVSSKRAVIFSALFMLTHLAACLAVEEREAYHLEPIVVMPNPIYKLNIFSLRNITYIDAQENATNESIADFLSRSSTMDITRRGPFGIQADVQMRGNSFEQTDIFIDGIKVNDPQTGHFNLDLPLFVEEIDKIVTITSPAASIYGASNSGGSIHFFIRKPEEEILKIQSVVGEHRYRTESISYSYKLGPLNSRSMLGKSESDGYRYNTDFDKLGFSQVSFLDTGYGDLKLAFNYLDKEFGANSFYSEFYPEQREHTKTIFTSLGLNSQISDFSLSPQVYWRRHWDLFMLDRTRPGWFENLHTNHLTGIKLDAFKSLLRGQLFFGIDTAQEDVDSTNLGKHKRLRHSLYSSYSGQIDNLLFSVGGTGFFYEHFKTHILPDLSAGCLLSNELKFHLAYSRSFRAPTFTELYYQDPVHQGNNELSPEMTRNYELGLNFDKDYASSSATFFINEGANLIDWVKIDPTAIYQAENILKVDSYGFECNYYLFPEKIGPNLKGWQALSAGYVFVDREKQDDNFISKYVFDYLKHKFIFGSKNRLPFFKLISDVQLNYLQRINKGGDFILDGKILREFKNFNIFLQISNMLNHAYTERGNMPMPGRWIFLGAELSW